MKTMQTQQKKQWRTVENHFKTLKTTRTTIGKPCELNVQWSLALRLLFRLLLAKSASAVITDEQIRMFEIKLSQGAKPGKGGILPGAKVTAEIAAIRGIDIGEDSISPNGHPDINSVEDLLDMVAHIRDITGKPVGFKVVIGSSAWIDNMCSIILARGIESAPDFITIDSADGGTGAAPQSLMVFSY